MIDAARSRHSYSRYWADPAARSFPLLSFKFDVSFGKLRCIGYCQRDAMDVLRLAPVVIRTISSRAATMT